MLDIVHVPSQENEWSGIRVLDKVYIPSQENEWSDICVLDIVHVPRQENEWSGICVLDIDISFVRSSVILLLPLFLRFSFWIIEMF
jgi:hypothetical protein